MRRTTAWGENNLKYAKLPRADFSLAVASPRKPPSSAAARKLCLPTNVRLPADRLGHQATARRAGRGAHCDRRLGRRAPRRRHGGGLAALVCAVAL
eukprot:1192087-Prymnesium_polylepis.1